MEYIPRALEDRLRRYEKTYKAVLVTGARQVGKSTLLKKVFPARRYVSLDDPFLEQQAEEAGDMFLTLNPPPVTIDEVQRAKGLFRYIKIKCDEREEKGLFCLIRLTALPSDAGCVRVLIRADRDRRAFRLVHAGVYGRSL